MPETLEPRILAASLLYSLDAPDGPLHVGQSVEVRILGQPVYDAAPTTPGIFSWGVAFEWNSQWLELTDVAFAEGHDWLPLADPLGEVAFATDGLDIGGLIDFDVLPQSSDPVELVALTLGVVDGTTPGTLAGVQLSHGSRPSAILGVDEYVPAGLTGAWVLWDVDRQPGHNAALPADVDGDGLVSPRDALLVVNDFLTGGPRAAEAGPYMRDVDGDGTQSTPADVLAVFGELG